MSTKLFFCSFGRLWKANSFERFNGEKMIKDGQHLPDAFEKRFLCKLKCAPLKNDRRNSGGTLRQKFNLIDI